MVETRYGRLQIEEDMGFQRRSWQAERLGWLILVLIVLASILGLIDKGPLSKIRRGDAGTLELEYERFIHRDTPVQLHVRLPIAGPFSVQLPFAYVEKVEISRIVPEPQEVASHGGVVTYSFAGGSGMADVLFHMTVRKAGSVKGYVQSGRHRVDFRQFVYP